MYLHLSVHAIRYKSIPGLTVLYTKWTLNVTCRFMNKRRRILVGLMEPAPLARGVVLRVRLYFRAPTMPVYALPGSTAVDYLVKTVDGHYHCLA